MAPGSARNRPALGALAPHSPHTPGRLRAPAPARARHPGGTGAPEERKLTCLSGAGKSLVPTPFSGSSGLADSSGRGDGGACALGFVLRTGPGGGGEGKGGEGAGLPPPRRPPPALRPDSMLAAPCPGDYALLPREAWITFGLPEGPGANKLSPGRRPHAPRFLGQPGSDRCLGDRLSFVPKERGTRAGSPGPPRSGPFPRPPPPAVTLGRPLSGSAAGGPCWRLATCTFETKQIRPPARSLRSGAGSALSWGGIL